VSAGLGACAWPFMPLLRASAQAPYPKRLLLFYTPHGTIYDGWKPSGTRDDFTLGSILAPLERHKSKLNVLDGLRIQHSRVPAPPHTEGMSLVWTGSHLGQGNTFMVQEFPIDWVEGPSVDQVIAQRVGAATAFRSLELGVKPAGSSPTSRMIYAGARQPVQPESNPARAFDRLFSGALPGAMPDAAAALRLARRRSVLDVVAGQLTGLQGKLASDLRGAGAGDGRRHPALARHRDRSGRGSVRLRSHPGRQHSAEVRRQRQRAVHLAGDQSRTP
jgi:hypothetical protein